MKQYTFAPAQADPSKPPSIPQTRSVSDGNDSACGGKPCFTRESNNGDYLVAPSGALERRRSGVWISRRAEIAIEEAARNNEQHRIGQQLHDDLGGVLTGLNACLSVLIERAERAGGAPDPLLVDASSLAHIAFDTVRQVAKKLRPPLLDYLGIWEAIEWNVNMLARRSDICCELIVAPEVRSIELDGSREMVIFRVVCEALTNIERHARASHAVVSIAEQAGVLVVSIVDDGIGFCNLGLGSLGLSGMKERARELGGGLSVETTCGGGTELHLSVPVGYCDGT